MEQEFETSKNYKSELKWFDGAWSRFKPGLGKDKRGVSGVDKKKLVEIFSKLFTIAMSRVTWPNPIGLEKKL